MKPKIYYLTRSYYPYQKGGGPLMRTGAVKYLQELGWDVIVVMPNYENKEFKIEDGIWQIPFPKKHIQKLASLFERVGLYEDYLDKWVDNAFECLKDKITKNDIVFATSGGELGTIKLGSLLKTQIKCKFVINFRDPLHYSIVNGLKVDNRFHISREAQEKRYLTNSDLIVTSSMSYQNSLKFKYPDFKNKIVNNYFGYIEKIEVENNIQNNKKLRIAYSGSMLSDVQMPEILFSAYKLLKCRKNVELYFIGNLEQNKFIKNINEEGVYTIGFLPHKEYLKFMSQNIDVGFVSLVKDYYGACVPSKVYEYINLELPILGALPDGDGIDIINNREYGIAVNHKNISELSQAIDMFKDSLIYEKFKNNVVKAKNSWSMKEKIIELDFYLKGIL